MIAAAATEHQMQLHDNGFHDEDFLLHSLDPKEDYNSMSNHDALTVISENGSLPDLMDGSGSDDDNFAGNEFLRTDNVGLVTPAKCASRSSNSSMGRNVPTDVVATSSSRTTTTAAAAIGEPCQVDVLCGQSRTCANHAGNKRFQSILDTYAARYEAAEKKQEKMSLTKEIVARVAASGGRFLKFRDGAWIQIPNVTARDKVSHALRTKAQSWKKRQEQAKRKKKSPAAAAPNNSNSNNRKRSATRGNRRNTGRANNNNDGSSSRPGLSEIKAVSFDGSTASSASVMDELLRTQQEIFDRLIQSNGMHPLK